MKLVLGEQPLQVVGPLNRFPVPIPQPGKTHSAAEIAAITTGLTKRGIPFSPDLRAFPKNISGSPARLSAGDPITYAYWVSNANCAATPAWSEGHNPPGVLLTGLAPNKAMFCAS